MRKSPPPSTTPSWEPSEKWRMPSVTITATGIALRCSCTRWPAASRRPTTRSEPASPIASQPSGLGATPHVQGLAADEPGLLTAQEGDGRRDVLRLADPLDGDLGGRALLELLEVDPHPVRGLLGHGRLDEAGSDRVDCDVVAAELDRQRPRHALQAGLGGRVVGLAAVAERGGRAHEHHPPVLLRNLHLLRLACGEEG